MTADELVPYFVASASLAEQLRGQTSRVVFVLGCELTLFDKGFVPGVSTFERMQTMTNPALLANQAASPEEMERRFNDFLGRAVAAVRKDFAGPVTYASAPWENVDWSPFDLVSVDHYRDAGNRDSYREQLRAYFVSGRPVVVTEFGCCTFRGAPDRGALGWAIVDRAAQPPRLTEDVVRDEQVQADYLTELLDTLEGEGVDGAFWFTFASFNSPHHDDPRYDLDCASYGVVKILEGAAGKANPGMPWEPKRSFYALAERYAREVLPRERPTPS